MSEASLGRRVEKAKNLIWSFNPHCPSHYGTWGSNEDNGSKYYNIDLSHSQAIVIVPDREFSMTVLEITCKQDTGLICNCPGNSHHTVCYHGMGALYESFKRDGKLINFFETYEAAIRRKSQGKVVRVRSLQGKGFLWATIEEWPKEEEQLIMTLPEKAFESRIDMFRGKREMDEGID